MAQMKRLFETLCDIVEDMLTIPPDEMPTEIRQEVALMRADPGRSYENLVLLLAREALGENSP